jgi:hypothetical protein
VIGTIRDPPGQSVPSCGIAGKADDALFKFCTRLDGTNDLVTGSEDSIEEVELFS